HGRADDRDRHVRHGGSDGIETSATDTDLSDIPCEERSVEECELDNNPEISQLIRCELLATGSGDGCPPFNGLAACVSTMYQGEGCSPRGLP
ncbi:MAG: hypothetical protein KC636_29140, partial [Myxococcales bacterium]|nr:hypothetical protein [Myxococcales bacterium]